MEWLTNYKQNANSDGRRLFKPLMKPPRVSSILKRKAFENNVGKGENADPTKFSNNFDFRRPRMKKGIWKHVGKGITTGKHYRLTDDIYIVNKIENIVGTSISYFSNNVFNTFLQDLEHIGLCCEGQISRLRILSSWASLKYFRLENMYAN